MEQKGLNNFTIKLPDCSTVEEVNKLRKKELIAKRNEEDQYEHAFHYETILDEKKKKEQLHRDNLKNQYHFSTP